MNKQNYMARRMIRIVVLAVLTLFSGGCMLKHDPQFAPVPPVVQSQPMPNNGAIYQTGYDVRLFEDRVARRLGDVLTVLLVENTNVTKTDNLNQKKDSELSMNPPTVFGYTVDFLQQDASFNRESTSANNGKQNYKLNGTLSVTVVEVLSNGNLVVRGEKRLGLTGGNEYVKLSGIVRPVDIDVANTVPSTSVADATIVYEGEGQMADASKKGWLERFFYSPWFPF
ncbi:MAG: flagellar basal body L-ring protein FlgH [Methylococcales bacterium]